ncbi:EF-hand domain-containing protein [Ketogulonicigenium vulgare]|uniref:EF-hand domain-containing protein n=1 Tax=Ketogulonicigenium vulgare TaxID=92945 RepID=UPI00235A3C6D|nr:EF-hand domain-containing protein [Ketogulonicigenium vulgare]
MAYKLIASGAIATAVAALAVAAFGTTASAQPAPAPQAAPEAGSDAAPRGFSLPPFEVLDVNGDGQIDAADFDAMEAQRAAERFAAIDTNGDGAISPEELATAPESLRQARALARANALIARLDSNGDGVLSAEEIAAAPMQRGFEGRPGPRGHANAPEGRAPEGRARGPMQDSPMHGGPMQGSPMHGGPRGPGIARMIQALDTDGNGAISAEEYAAAPERLREMHRGMRGAAGEMPQDRHQGHHQDRRDDRGPRD